MINAFQDLSSQIMDTCDKDLHDLNALKAREAIITSVNHLLSKHLGRINDKATKRVIESLRSSLKECEPTFLEADRLHQQIKKQIGFLRGAVNTSKSESEMESSLKQLSTFYSQYLLQKKFLQKLGKINVKVDLEVDDASLVEFLLRFVKLKVDIDNKKTIEKVVSSKRTRLEEELTGQNEKLKKERDQAMKKLKESSSQIKDKTLLLSKEIKAKEHQIRQLEQQNEKLLTTKADSANLAHEEIEELQKKNKAELEQSQAKIAADYEQKIKIKEDQIRELKAIIQKSTQTDELNSLKSKHQKELETQEIKNQANIAKFEEYLREAQDKLDSQEERFKTERKNLVSKQQIEADSADKRISDLKIYEKELEEKLKLAVEKVGELQEKQMELSHQLQTSELERDKMEEGRFLKLVMLVDQYVSSNGDGSLQNELNVQLNKHYTSPYIEWTQGFKRIGDMETERKGESYKIVLYKAKLDLRKIKEDQFMKYLEVKKKEWGLHSVDIIHKSFSLC